jgi:osmoprotectant transport system permease protein
MRLALPLLIVVCLCATGPAHAGDSIAVGSKNFSESRLLAEIFAQLLEARLESPVDRRFNLAGTTICFRALQNGEIDVYPEYSGTGLVTLLEQSAGSDPAEVMGIVRREFRERWNLHWLAPLGFENSYELAVPRALAEAEGLRTISELVAVAPRLRAAFGYEFQSREDGLLGLARVYGLTPGSVVGMQQTLKYAAAGSGEIDLLDVYTTDGLITVHDLVVLEDDRGVFPPYEAAPLISATRPELALVLNELGGLLPVGRMRELNRRAEVDRESIESIASDFLREAGLLSTAAPVAATARGAQPFPQFMWSRRSELLAQTGQHILLVLISLIMASVVAVAAGLWLSGHEAIAERAVRGVGLLQTMPSIALLAFMIPLLGVGAKPAIAALFLYGLFPILRNTVTGIRGVDAAVVESAMALGMDERQLMLQVKLPLALPVLLAGVRTAAVINVGTATLAAFIGAGGLGQPIVAGLQLNDSALILSGALPAALLAWAVDGGLALFERRVSAGRTLANQS